MLMILIYPIYSSGALIEMNFELKCSTFKNVIAAIKNSSSAKIDFIESFSSGILNSFKTYKKNINPTKKYRIPNESEILLIN